MHVTRINEQGAHEFERVQRGIYERFGKRKKKGTCCNYIKISKIKSV